MHARCLEKLPAHELLIDDPAYFPGVVAVRRQHVDIVALRQAAADDVVALHGEFRAQKAHALHALTLDLGAQRIGDVQKRDAGLPLDRFAGAMHRVAAHDDEVRACQFEVVG